MSLTRLADQGAAGGVVVLAILSVLAPVDVAAGRDGAAGQSQLPTNLQDFFHPGTQPETLTDPFIDPANCDGCHGGYDDGQSLPNVEPYDMWVTSLMAQAARDPIWHAALTISNQDSAMSGEFCIRCHAPNAWLEGRSDVADLSEFTPTDFEGVFCHFCHRMVDPVADAENPVEDTPILADLANAGLLPMHRGNAQYVIDPVDTRRGPYDDVPINFHPVPILVSPFHWESQLCGTCHDVSNPVFSRQKDGTYALNDFGAPHPTGDPADMFPEQRTYSEWTASSFAAGGVQLDGRFGGNHATGVMESCQDCHMPDAFGGGCFAWESPPFFPREDLGNHQLLGGNTWVLSAILDIYGPDSHLTPETVADAQAGVRDLLRAASDMDVSVDGSTLNVRVTNYSGHKLPTGYPEGRRMWINVRFFDDLDELILEHGFYDELSGDLVTADTKVYEAKHSFDESVATVTGLPAGTLFHLALNNVIVKDNRIPPIGFTNAAFEAVQAEPVGAVYADGQHWDDTAFAIPPDAASAVVTLFFQTTSKEYAEFLRDGTDDGTGPLAHAQWIKHGRSQPVDMDMVEISLVSIPGDVNGDGFVNVDDLLLVLAAWGDCPPSCPPDIDMDGDVDVDDLLVILANWT